MQNKNLNFINEKHIHFKSLNPFIKNGSSLLIKSCLQRKLLVKQNN